MKALTMGMAAGKYSTGWGESYIYVHVCREWHTHIVLYIKGTVYGESQEPNIHKCL